MGGSSLAAKNGRGFIAAAQDAYIVLIVRNNVIRKPGCIFEQQQEFWSRCTEASVKSTLSQTRNLAWVTISLFLLIVRLSCTVHEQNERVTEEVKNVSAKMHPTKRYGTTRSVIQKHFDLQERACSERATELTRHASIHQLLTPPPSCAPVSCSPAPHHPPPPPPPHGHTTLRGPRGRAPAGWRDKSWMSARA